MIRLIQFGLALFLAASGISAAENATPEFLFKNWRNEDGLPHSIINSILQTRDGYLWIGTYVGLSRFDGARFSNFNSSNVPELESEMISCLFEDHLGRLWVGLNNGRLLFWQDGLAHIQVSNSVSQVICMAETQDGALWLQRRNGKLGRLTGQEIKTVADCGSVLNPASLGLVVDRQDRLWAGTSKGLKLWRDGGLVYPEGAKRLAKHPVDLLSLAPDGSVLTCQNRCLWKLTAQSVRAEIAIPWQLGDLAVVQEAADGSIWAGARENRLFYMGPNLEWTEIATPALEGANRVLYLDREGNLWRGSHSAGLTRIRPRVFTMHKIPGTINYANTLCADSSGTVSWGLNEQVLAQLPRGAQSPVLWTNHIPIGIRSLYADRQDTLWLGGRSIRIYQFAGTNFVSVPSSNLKCEYISAFFEDAASNIWVGCKGGSGVAFFPRDNPTNWHNVDGVTCPDVCSIAQAKDGAMWFGTHYGGAFRLKDGQLQQFTKRDGLCSDYVRCFYADTNGALWLGTMHGLSRWQNGTFVSVTSEHGLWNDSISHIEDARDGSLWISSFGGVFRVRLEELNQFAAGNQDAISCIGYNRGDGLEGLECPGGSQPVGARTPDGKLWFPTVSGLASVNPNELKENRLPPPVWIEDLSIDGKSANVTRSTSVISVPPGKRRLDFTYTALSLVAPEKIRFRHKLEGLESQWSAADGQRLTTYTYIPPGEYTFRVMACNNDAVWNTAGQSLHLVVRPFYWQTWWFKTTLGLSVIALVALVVQYFERLKARIRIERIQKRDAIERERGRIARDIHDDLGASLTQIVFLSQWVERRPGADLEERLKTVNVIVRRTVQSLDEIVWAINAKHDWLESLANYLSQFARKHLDLAGIKCVLDIPTVLPALALSAEVRHNLMLAAREALQNVVAHANATEVRVSLELTPTDLCIEIADNGNGFNPQYSSADGDGLGNLRKRLEMIGGQVTIVSQPGGGTKTRFSVSRQRLNGPQS